MRVMTIVAGHESFPNRVVRSSLNLRLHFHVAGGAHLIDHGFLELPLIRLRAVDRVACDAGNAAHFMDASLPVRLLSAFMASKAHRACLGTAHGFEGLDESNIASAFNVRLAGTMTGLATSFAAHMKFLAAVNGLLNAGGLVFMACRAFF